MQETEFARLIEAEFGPYQGPFIVNNHVVREFGRTPKELLEQGEDLRQVWWALCDDFDIPEDRRLGPDE
ncbi:DUF3046 domain-containing protein [Corynebacterium choanae]|uniref:DUF3046 domain-containing protein n=1 Tax=Corynebacterium choanae TaxID=1862358 RepID=A0A3G6J732_9CORY|nr:DUF3046 domain-containing protein [Corynebacterium choanae]AZA13786.1 hypothetical protein CCHOA_06970 [Corynebacterium choanae]